MPSTHISSFQKSILLGGCVVKDDVHTSKFLENKIGSIRIVLDGSNQALRTRYTYDMINTYTQHAHTHTPEFDAQLHGGHGSHGVVLATGIDHNDLNPRFILE